MCQRLLCEWFWLKSHLGAFYFGSSLMVALVIVKVPLFYFLQMFPNFCVQIHSLGLGVRFRV